MKSEEEVIKCKMENKNEEKGGKALVLGTLRLD
jgi:hypothetical protein